VAVAIPEASGARLVVPRAFLVGEEVSALRRRLGEALADGVSRVVVDLCASAAATSRSSAAPATCENYSPFAGSTKSSNSWNHPRTTRQMAEEEIQDQAVDQADAGETPEDSGPEQGEALEASEPNGDERRRAVAEILAELSDEIGDDATTEQETQAEEPPEPQEKPEREPEEPPQEPAEEPTPRPEERLEEPAPEPPEPPEPQEEGPAPEPTPQVVPLAPPQAGISPRTLILVHAAIIVVFFIGTWLTTRSIVGTVVKVAARPTAQVAVPRPATPRAPAAAPRRQTAPAPEPVVQLDKGLRYVQLVERADVLFEKGNYSEAAKTYEEALAAMPPNWNDGAAAFRLGECRFRLGNYPRAIAAYEKVAAAFPGDYQPKALFRLGEAHIKLGAFAKAREAFFSLLLLQGRVGSEVKPLVEQAYYRVADCYWNEARQVAETRRGEAR